MTLQTSRPRYGRPVSLLDVAPSGSVHQGRDASLTAADPEFASALEVHEMLLEVTRQAYLDRDVDAFASRFHLPCEVNFFDTSLRLSARADVAEFMMSMRIFAGDNDAVSLVRLSVSADFLDLNTIATTHLSYVVANGQLLDDPWHCHSVARRFDGRWKFTSSDYANVGLPSPHAQRHRPVQTRRPTTQKDRTE